MGIAWEPVSWHRTPGWVKSKIKHMHLINGQTVELQGRHYAYYVTVSGHHSYRIKRRPMPNIHSHYRLNRRSSAAALVAVGIITFGLVVLGLLRLSTGHSYNPKAVNPNEAQLTSFLATDNTDTNLYTSSFTCEQFAETLQAHAEKAGYRCALVYLFYGSGLNETATHEIDAFQVVGYGLTYVEPQSDNIVQAMVGQTYDADPPFVITRINVSWPNWFIGNEDGIK